jgi:hypothetical protein
MVSATFTVDNPQNPGVEFISPVPGFRGTIDNRTLIGYLYSVRWNGSDPDGGVLTYRLYYRIEGSVAWVPLFDEEDYTLKEFVWNVSKFTDGVYYLKIVVTDPSGLKGEKVIGSFTLKVPEPYKPPVIIPDDNKDNNGTDELDLSQVAIIAGVILLVVIILTVIAVVLMGVLRKKKPAVPVVPKEEDVDLTVPDFDREDVQTMPLPSEAQNAAENLVPEEEVPHDEAAGHDKQGA